MRFCPRPAVHQLCLCCGLDSPFSSDDDTNHQKCAQLETPDYPKWNAFDFQSSLDS